MPGKKLHTGRSRNDQVALDMKLYTRDEIDAIDGLLKELLAGSSEDHGREYPYLHAGLYPSAESTAGNSGSSYGCIF